MTGQPWDDDQEHVEAKAERKRGPTQAEQLVALAGDVELWHTEDGEAFGTITVPDGHREHWPVQSRVFRDVLRQRFFDDTGKVPANQALVDAVGCCEGKAQFHGESHPAPVRVAELDGNLYIDLCDPAWRAIEITSTGWCVVERPPVRFRRAPGMTALPVPMAAGSIEVLRPFVHGDETAFRLIVGWLVQAWCPAGPYMVLVLLGEQGSGKSFLARLLRRLIDPSTMLLRSTPREERDLAIGTRNGYVIALDNVSGLSVWLSDALCRLATGGGVTARKLYSDDQEMFFKGTRPVILNGIEGVATKGDLLSRALLVTLTPITNTVRRTERALLAAFDEAAPAILGGLLDAAVAALANRDRVDVELPRMADAAKWIVAAESALPWPAGGFLETYGENQNEAVEIALEADVMGTLLLQFMAGKPFWSGSAAALLSELGALADDHTKRSRAWPARPKELGGSIDRLAPALRARGLQVSRAGSGKRGRPILLENVAGGTAATTAASAASCRKAPEENEPCGSAEGLFGTQVTARTAASAASAATFLSLSLKPEGERGERGDLETPGNLAAVAAMRQPPRLDREPGDDDEVIP